MAESTQILGSIPINRGEYSSTEDYYKDNVVMYNNCAWYCKADTSVRPLVNSTPSLDNPNWGIWSGLEPSQETGYDEAKFMSQKATTEAINSMGNDAFNFTQIVAQGKTNNIDFENHMQDNERHLPLGGKAGQWLTMNSKGQLEWAYMDTVDFMAYGVEWDITQTTPICTRVGNPLLCKSLPIQSGFRGCVHNKGKVNYYLGADDWAYKEDMKTPSVLDGTDGNVGVDTGTTFYGKSFILDNKRRVYVSTNQIDDTWIKIPRMIVDAYRSTVDTTEGTSATLSKMASVVNTTAQFRGGSNRANFDTYLSTDKARTDLGKPRTSLGRQTMRQYASNAGGMLIPYEYYKWIFYWLPVIEYANFNCQDTYNPQLTSDGYRQGGLGPGVTTMNRWNEYNGNNPITPCGHANSIGNFTGNVDLVLPTTTSTDGSITIPTQTLKVVKWRGFENPFGDVWTNMDQVIIQNDQSEKDASGNCLYKNVYTLVNPERLWDLDWESIKALNLDTLPNENFKVVGRQANTDGNVLEFDLGETGEIIPSKIGGSNTQGKCDNNWVGGKTDTSVRTLRFGGSAYIGSAAGLGTFTSTYGVAYATSYIGFRGCYKYKK